MPASTAVTPTVSKGAASSFAVLAGETVTSTGATNISGSAGGNVGLYPGTSIVPGTPAYTISGVAHAADTVAQAAKASFTSTYGVLAGATGSSVGPELGGITLLAGVHESAAELLISTGTILTLDARDNANAVFIIKAGTALTTIEGSSVVLANGAQACNVYWQIGSSATLGTGTTFVGHIYANISISAASGATIYGQLLAGSGEVTLINDTIVNDNCASVSPPINYGGSTYIAPVPDQDSSITGISSSACSATSGYVANLTGTFPAPVTNISVAGNNIDSSRWTQTANTIAIQIPPSETKSFTIDVYNGRTPTLASQTFVCTDVVAIPAVIETESPIVTPTETGGALPKTSTNDYSYLLAGIGISFLGASGLLLRKRTQK